MRGLGQIDTDQSKPLPSPGEYVNYALPILKAAAAVEPGAVFEVVNEPWEKNNHAGLSNAAPYAAIVKATYEAVEAQGVNVHLLVAGRNYNGEWFKTLANGLGPVKSKVWGFTSHPYGSLNLNGSGSGGNHNLASMVQQHQQAVADGFPEAATNNWWDTETGWYLTGEDEQEAEVPNVTVQAQRYTELDPIAKRLHEQGWLQALFPYAQSDSSGHWNITSRGALTQAGLAYVNGIG
jgi:hypothetical protein